MSLEKEYLIKMKNGVHLNRSFTYHKNKIDVEYFTFDVEDVYVKIQLDNSFA